MNAAVSPTARRYELARRLKELREESGSTLEQIAQVLACSVTKVSRLESAQRLPTALDLRVLAEFYEVEPQAAEAMLTLLADSRKKGWWHDLRNLDQRAKTYIGLESDAVLLRQVELLRIPGLLQSPGYVRSLLPRLRPHEVMGNLDQYVELRRRRQERLRSGELQAHFIIDEAAVSRRLGPPGLMRRQIDYMLELAALDNVCLQAITFDVGSHPALDEPFTVLDFAQGESARQIVMEGAAGMYFLGAASDGDLARHFLDVFDEASKPRFALSADDTVGWLEAHKEKLDPC